MLLFK